MRNLHSPVVKRYRVKVPLPDSLEMRVYTHQALKGRLFTAHFTWQPSNGNLYPPDVKRYCSYYSFDFIIIIYICFYIVLVFYQSYQSTKETPSQPYKERIKFDFLLNKLKTQLKELRRKGILEITIVHYKLARSANFCGSIYE